MKKLDKLKRTRYEISMKIIQFEDIAKKRDLSKRELQELTILQKKEKNLDDKIKSV